METTYEIIDGLVEKFERVYNAKITYIRPAEMDEEQDYLLKYLIENANVIITWLKRLVNTSNKDIKNAIILELSQTERLIIMKQQEEVIIDHYIHSEDIEWALYSTEFVFKFNK